MAARILATEPLQGLPNILLYGCKYARLVQLMRECMEQRFGRLTRREVATEDNVIYFETPYFFEIDLANPNMSQDIAHLSQFVHTIVSHASIHTERHIIIMYNIDRFKDRQSLRVLVERHTERAIFFATTHALGGLEAPVRSRFLLIRVPLENPADLSACAVLDEADAVLKAKPSLEDIRALAIKTFQQGVPLAALPAWFVKHRRLSPQVIAAAANLEHRFKCTNGGRELLYHELMLHILTQKKYVIKS
jgi:hypothetical protein